MGIGVHRAVGFVEQPVVNKLEASADAIIIASVILNALFIISPLKVLPGK